MWRPALVDIIPLCMKRTIDNRHLHMHMPLPGMLQVYPKIMTFFVDPIGAQKKFGIRFDS